MRGLLLGVAMMMLPAAALAQPSQRGSSVLVAVNVSIAIPAGAPRALVEAGMAKSVPVYQKVPSLIRKYFTIGQSDFGGIYLFKDRASAQAWFSDAWRAKAIATYGAQPIVTYSDVPFVVDNVAAR